MTITYEVYEISDIFLFYLLCELKTALSHNAGLLNTTLVDPHNL